MLSLHFDPDAQCAGEARRRRRSAHARTGKSRTLRHADCGILSRCRMRRASLVCGGRVANAAAHNHQQERLK